MLRNYLKVAIRSLGRGKVHALINITGLSLGIACCMLIVIFVRDEWTFDRFHKKADRIFRVYAIEDYGENQRFFNTSTPFPMGPALKENFEEVEAMVRINPVATQVKAGEVLFSEYILIAGTSFLEMFDFEIISGANSTSLSEPLNVLLTARTARKFFGTADPIGKTISIALADRFEDFTVKAILKDPPSNSSVRFTMIISDLNYPKIYSERTLNSAWFNISPETYVLLRDGTDASALEKKFPPVFRTLLGDDFEKSKYFVGLQPLTTIHLDTSFPPAIAPVSDPRYSYILSAIAFLILVVACINFVTLSVGRSMKRSREVGIRKVVGASRKQLVFQFVGEAVIITLLSLVIGVGLALLNLPVFNEMAGKQLGFRADAFMAVVLISLVIVIGLFAGSYPAFVLSGFKPVSVLKGSAVSGDTKQLTRKILVGIQLVLAVFLISSTLLMNRQLDFLQKKNLGFSREQLAVLQLSVPQSGRLGDRIRSGFEKARQFKTEFKRISGVRDVCVSAHDFGDGGWTDVGFTDDNGTYRTFHVNIVDETYIPVMKMELVAGRNFSDDNPADMTRSIIVNEAFVKEHGWKEAIGRRIPGKNFAEHEIIGVVKDFHYESLYVKVGPLVLARDPGVPFSGIENMNIDNSPIPKLLLRLEPGNASLAMDEIRATWNRLTGGQEFEFTFVDQALAAQYRADQNLGRIVSTASLLSIVIASLGLYGLASLALQNRTKEIGIRKVLGASGRSLLMLLSKEYLMLVIISLIVSVPLTIYMMKRWLASFEYRVGIGPDIFLLAGGISLLIAMVTISYQVLKTTWTQPAQTLKHE